MSSRVYSQHVLITVSVIWYPATWSCLWPGCLENLHITQYILQILPNLTLVYLNNPNCQYNLQSVKFYSLSCPNRSFFVSLSLSCMVTWEANHDHCKTVCAVEHYSIYQCLSVDILLSHIFSTAEMEESAIWQMCFLLKMY